MAVRSVIGDYIHLTNKGYDYGILPKSVQSENFTNHLKQSDALGVFKEQKNKIDRMIQSKGTIEEAKVMENQISNFLNLLDSPNQDDKNFLNKIVANVEQDLKTEIDSRCMNVKDPLEGTVDKSIVFLKRLAKDIQKDKGKDGQIKQQAYITAQRVYELIKQFNNFNDMLKTGVIDKKLLGRIDVDDVMDRSQQLIDAINTLYPDGGRSKSRLYIRDYKKQTKKGSKYNKDAFYITDSKTGDKISLLTFAEEIGELLGPISWDSNQKKGDVAELMLAAGSAYFKNAAEKNLQKTMSTVTSEKIWRGKNKTNTTIVTGNFISAFRTVDLPGYEKIKLDDSAEVIVAKGEGSQDKVDVIFYYSPNLGAVKTSVKNYSLYNVKKSGFSGVSEAPFLSLVHLLDANFVNHWINNTILHARWSNFYKPDQRGVYIAQAHQVMKYALIAYGALGGYIKTDRETGITGAQDQVDYLVWNNNKDIKKHDIRVYPFSQLLANCYEDIEKNSGWINQTGDTDYGYFYTKDWSTVKFLKMAGADKNVAAQAARRVLLMLTKLHEIKISTHILVSGL